MLCFVKWRTVVSAGNYNNKVISSLPEVNFKIFTITYSDIVQMCISTLKKFKKHLKCYQIDSSTDGINNGNDRNIRLTLLNYWYPVPVWQIHFFNNSKYPVSMSNQNPHNHSSHLGNPHLLYNNLRYCSNSKTQGQRYGKYKFQNHIRNNGKNNYKVDQVMSLRTWEHVNFQSDKPGFVFSLMSYNVLAQDLLEQHPYLYVQHNKHALEWETRWNNLLTEIKKFYPDIICLQEVQESHIKKYYSVLESLGYSGVYKKRTGIRIDGCAIYFKEDKLKLIDHFHVEFFYPEIAVLNRDNVGLIVKLAPKNHPKREFVVATTHLLYNPRRSDVRLAQMQLFLAEIDRIGYQKQFGKSSHIPVILTGDLNTQPDSELYKLIITGEINYKYFLSNSWNKNSEVSKLVSSNSGNRPQVDIIKTLDPVTLSNVGKAFCTTSDDSSVTFSMERQCLTENFSFRSAYDHGDEQNSKATTFQDQWVTVDYIFYSARKNKNNTEDKLKLLSRWKLPSKEEMRDLWIPNKHIGSDHLCLVAKFKLEY